jgi:hypothetical protein
MNRATAFHQTDDVVPLDVVVYRMTENLLDGEPVVVIELDSHRNEASLNCPYNEPFKSTLPYLSRHVKQSHKFHVLRHREKIKHPNVAQCVRSREQVFYVSRKGRRVTTHKHNASRLPAKQCFGDTFGKAGPGRIHDDDILWSNGVVD